MLQYVFDEEAVNGEIHVIIGKTNGMKAVLIMGTTTEELLHVQFEYTSEEVHV